MKTPLTFFFCILLNYFPLLIYGQLVTITGKLTNDKNGSTVANADILECKSKTGTISDKNGFYQLILSPGTIDLLISIDGFVNYSQKLYLHSDTTISIALKPVKSVKIKSKTGIELIPESNSKRVENRHHTLK